MKLKKNYCQCPHPFESTNQVRRCECGSKIHVRQVECGDCGKKHNCGACGYHDWFTKTKVKHLELKKSGV